MRSDIAIIGAGIAGITTAYALAKKGHKVTLIDSEDILQWQLVMLMEVS